MISDAERIEQQSIWVPDCGCRLWTGSVVGMGYGRFSKRVDGISRTFLAHRTSYELANGPIPKDLCVLHKCDTPACINPDHLFLGTYLDNNRDREAKGRGRQQRGIRHGRNKLTECQVQELRALMASGVRPWTAAKRFGITAKTASDIERGKIWKYLPKENVQ